MGRKPVPEGGWWPSWRYGPNDEAEVFASAEDVPEGWLDSPGAHGQNLTKEPPKAADTSPVSRPNVIAALKARNAKVDVKLTTKALYDQLVELVEAEA